MPVITALIQARMSSTRFPGKVLHSFLGRPVISHILDSVASVPAIDRVVVVTSEDETDDQLVRYLEAERWQVFRGPLLDVFRRFQLAANQYPSDFVMRLCADSPLLSPAVVAEVTRHAKLDPSLDVVTTRFDPPFPKGQNAELIRTAALLGVNESELTDHDREHVTPWFYRNRDRYRVVNASQVAIDLPGREFTVDTPADLARLEQAMGSKAWPSDGKS